MCVGSEVGFEPVGAGFIRRASAKADAYQER
jgi:hypothetical protein